MQSVEGPEDRADGTVLYRVGLGLVGRIRRWLRPNKAEIRHVVVVVVAVGIYLPTGQATSTSIQYSTPKTPPRTRVGEMNLSSYACRTSPNGVADDLLLRRLRETRSALFGYFNADRRYPLVSPGAPDYHALGVPK